jgi:hypothetical protein
MEHPNHHNYEGDSSPKIELIEESPEDVAASLHSESSIGPERGRYMTVIWPPVGGSGK